MKRFRAILAVGLLAFSSCASADGFFSGPSVIHAGGSFNIARVQTVFVHDGQTAYAEWRSRVIAYGGVTYADSGASVEGFDNAVIYYRDGAYISTYGHARAYRCPGPANARWDAAACVRTR